MKRRLVVGSLVVVVALALAGAALVLAVVPRASATPAHGCVDGGKGYVGVVPDSGGEVLNWHGTYIISLCPGATGPQAGDSDVQTITYPDGTYERYKIVYSTADLTASNGVFCYWDLTMDPGTNGPGYHCPAGSNQGDLYWYIVSSSGTSPYLEPANLGGWKSNPNGIGVYK